MSDEWKYAGQYTWFYYSITKCGYLCQIYKVFYIEHGLIMQTIWKEDFSAMESQSLI